MDPLTCSHPGCSEPVSASPGQTCGESGTADRASCAQPFCTGHLYYVAPAGRCLCKPCCDRWDATHRRCRCKKHRMTKRQLTGV